MRTMCRFAQSRASCKRPRSFSGRRAMREDGKLDYLELPATDMAAHKTFYSQAFGWTFQDYGPTYAAFSEGLDGGFDADGAAGAPPLPVLYATDIEAALKRVTDAG